MAARFEALDELFDDSLTLPVQGKTYTIPSPSAGDGLKVQRITGIAARMMAAGEDAETELLDDDEEADLLALCLGPAFEELQADGVSWAWIKHIGLTAMFWITSDLETAERYWAAAGDPEALAPNREARRAAKKNGSAAASKTPRRGSTSGTSARKATKPARKAAKT